MVSISGPFMTSLNDIFEKLKQYDTIKMVEFISIEVVLA
jgi:hypothetical protein